MSINAELLKYIAFFTGSAVAIPVGLLLLYYRRQFLPLYLSFIVLFLLFDVDINILPRPEYRSYIRGFEVSVIDVIILVFALYLLSQKEWHRFLKFPAGSLLYFLYFVGASISLIHSDNLLYSCFELFRLIRMFFFFYFLYHIIQTRQHINWILNAISITLILNFILMLKQRYVDHMFQTSGFFPHQNSSVMYINLFCGIFFAYLLNSKEKKNLLLASSMLVFLISCLSTLLTLSRAGILSLILSLGFILIVSFWPIRQITPQKITILILIFLSLSVIGLRSLDTIMWRFQHAPVESARGRVELAQAALNMVQDKSLGIGLNNFGLKVNTPYPYANHIERYSWHSNGLVESVYLLIAAESGWHTLLFYLLFLGLFLIKTLKVYFMSQTPFYRALALGIAGGLIANYFESLFEWVLKQSANNYQFLFVFALILAIERLVKTENLSSSSNHLDLTVSDKSPA